EQQGLLRRTAPGSGLPEVRVAGGGEAGLPRPALPRDRESEFPVSRACSRGGAVQAGISGGVPFPPSSGTTTGGSADAGHAETQGGAARTPVGPRVRSYQERLSWATLSRAGVWGDA